MPLIYEENLNYCYFPPSLLGVGNFSKDQDFFSMNLMPFQARDAMFKMEYADLSFNRALLSIDILASKYQDLQTKINSGFFGKESTNESIISSGKSLHEQVLTYLEHKVLDEGDIDF